MSKFCGSEACLEKFPAMLVHSMWGSLQFGAPWWSEYACNIGLRDSVFLLDSKLFPAFGVGQVVVLSIFCHCVPCCGVETLFCEDIDGHKGWGIIFPVYFHLIPGTAAFGCNLWLRIPLYSMVDCQLECALPEVLLG